MANEQAHITNNTYTIQTLQRLIDGRKLYIFGAGIKGRAALLALLRNGFHVDGIIDSTPSKIGTRFRGITIEDERVFLSNQDLCQQCFVIVAGFTDSTNKIMLDKLEKSGFKKSKNCIEIKELQKFYPSIDVSGICNLKCIACPRGGDVTRFGKGGFMTASEYEKVIQKLLKEMPFLDDIELYIWGEPLLNPELPQIVRINHKLGIGCGISTNLNAGKHLEELVKSEPTEIRIAISGYGSEHYEVTHCGGKWEKIHNNLLKLAEYKKIYNVETQILVDYHVTTKNVMEYKDIYSLCGQLGFNLMVVKSMIFLEYALAYATGKELPATAKEAIKYMPVSLDHVLEQCRMEHDKRCLLARCLPSIAWDKSVYSCVSINDEKIADNYLNVSLDELIERRNNSLQCTRCIEQSCHRYQTFGLYRSYLEKIINDTCGLPAFR